MTVRMSNDEFKGQVSRFNTNVEELCSFIHMKTGAVIDPRTVRKQLIGGVKFSAPMTAVFRYTFRELEKGHEQQAG